MEMKGVLSVVLFILLRCHLGSALNCFSCSGDCADKNTRTCPQGELCMTQEFRDIDGKVDRQMDCLNPQFCKPGSTLPGIIQKCCDKDMCNDPKAVMMADPSNPPSGAAAPNGASDVSRETPLQCYSCISPCWVESKTTCKDKEVCVTKTGKFAGLDYHKLGCANTTVCDKDSTETIAGTTFSVNNKCCNTNLCNSAAVHLEVPAVAILAAIVAAWTSKLY